MPFKNISQAQEKAFLAALSAGQYNLLLGAGSSMDSRNEFGVMPSGEAFKLELCVATGAANKHSLQRVFSLLKEDQVDRLVTKRFSNCVPGKTPELISKFLWRRIFTWNVDDVIENIYKNRITKQNLKIIHYTDDFEEAQSVEDLMLIHLHGAVTTPEKGYVFSREQYIKQISTINPWMSVLSTFMRSEPIIIAGTSLDEVDLDYYLSFRTPATAREDRGPSIIVTEDSDAVTDDLCKRHNLLHFVGWSHDFFEHCSKLLPFPPTPEELIPQEERMLFPEGTSRRSILAFHADFELVPGMAESAPMSRFQNGHIPTWNDFSANLDIPRTSTASILAEIDSALKDDTSPAKLILLSENAGAGKTTIVRRVAFELAKRGVRTLFCSTLSRIDRAAAGLIDLIDRPVVIIVDNFADQVTAVSELLARLERRDAVVLAAERAYRRKYLESVLGDIDFLVVKDVAPTSLDMERLIDKYFEQGNIGDHNILRHKDAYARRLKGDPIAVACCRILKDFKPLERIVSDLVGDASEAELDRYLCAALAQHCFMGGVRYDILIGATGSSGIADQLEKNNPLPLTYYGSDRDYVVPENSTLAERVLIWATTENKLRLFDIFVSLANEIRPFVNREAIKRRAPEARLAGRLFDYDDIASKFLGDRVDQFYADTKYLWQWNSRYWEQVALLNLARYHIDTTSRDAPYFLGAAAQHARQAVAIEYHPFGLTTLGKVLMVQMMAPEHSMSETFKEAVENLVQAIEREAKWSRRAIQPFTTLFRGTEKYLAAGGELDSELRDKLRSQVLVAERKFPKDTEVTELIVTLRKHL